MTLPTSNVPPTGWYVEIDHPNGQTLTPEVLSDGARLEPTLNGQPEARLPVEQNDRYLSDDLEGAPMRVWKDGDRRAVDELVSVEERPDRTVLIGAGATDLERDVLVDVGDRPAHEVAEELVSEESDLVSDVDAPDAGTDADVVVADADDEDSFGVLFEIADQTPPLEFDDGELTMEPVSAILDAGTDNSQWGGASSRSDPDFSSGEAIEIDGSTTSAEAFIDFEYEVPAEHAELAVRVQGDEGDDVSVSVNGTTIGTVFGGTFDLQWQESVSLSTDFVIEDGRNSIDLVNVGGGSGSGYTAIDCIVLYDTRYISEFDNEVHEDDGFLDSPARFPEEPIVAETDVIPQFRRATAGSVKVTTNDDQGVFELAFSADNGATFATASDTDFFETGDLDEPGTSIRARVSIGKRRDLDAQDRTPRFGYEGQSIDDAEIRVDLDNTPLVLDRLLEGDIEDILNQIGETADAVWEARQDGDDTVLTWTYPGQRSDSRADGIADFSVTKHNRKILAAKVKGANAPRSETIEADVGETVDLLESDISRSKVVVRSADDDDAEPFRLGLDFEINAADGTLLAFAEGDIEDGELLDVEYEHTVTGVFEAEEWDGDRRERTTEQIPAATSARAAEQAARIIVEENKVPRFEADVTFPVGEIDDIRLTDALDLEGLPSQPEKVYEVDVEAGEVRLRLGNRSPVSETVGRLQSQLSAATDLV